MTRDLPRRPNLEHLRKQARTILPELQRVRPDAKLADALHAVARDYGFGSWPRLKAYVQSLPDPGLGAIPVHPLTGAWRANVGASKRHALNEFRSATLHIQVAGDTVTITQDAIDGLGHEMRDTSVVQVDGQQHQGAHGIGYIARWRGGHGLDVEALEDQRVINHGSYEVSPDGATLIVATTEQRIVLERVVH
jgi:hypothetical protein